MKYVIIYECKEARLPHSVQLTADGEKVLVTNSECGVTTSPVPLNGSFPADVKIFESEEACHAFMKTFDGHPWFAICNGNYQVVQVAPQTTTLRHGWKTC